MSGKSTRTKWRARSPGEPLIIHFVDPFGASRCANFSSPFSCAHRAKLEAWVLPVVTLKATDATGKEVKTQVSSNEASFVAGEFVNDQVMTNQRLAELAVEKMIEGLENGTVAFVLPGVQIMIFPIGLIITSIWLGLGLAAYGFGTYERYNFREAYRRRVALAQKGNMPRI